MGQSLFNLQLTSQLRVQIYGSFLKLQNLLIKYSQISVPAFPRPDERRGSALKINHSEWLYQAFCVILKFKKPAFHAHQHLCHHPSNGTALG